MPRSPLTGPGLADRAITGMGPGFARRAGTLLSPTVQALTTVLEDTDDLTTPVTDDGGRTSTWPVFADLDLTPFPRWLGQLAGVRVPAGLTLPDQIAYVRDAPYRRRGTIRGICEAVWPLLTGTQSVGITERADAGYPALGGANVALLQVRVYDSETTYTADEIKAAVLTAKPVGLLVEVYLIPDGYAVPTRFYRPGGVRTTYARRDVQYGTYADRSAAFVTYDDATRQRLIQRTNLLRDPSFEGATLRWQDRTGTTGTSLSAAQAFLGTKSLQVVASGTSAVSPRTNNAERAASIGSITAGSTYTASAYVRPPASGRSMQMAIDWFNSAGTFLSTSTYGPVLTSVAGTWQRVTVTAVAPATAVGFDVHLLFGAGAPGDTYFVDATVMEKASAVGAYFDGDTTDTPLLEFGWKGTPYASASVQKNAGP